MASVSAKLRNGFDCLPEGMCKDFVRGRTDNLLREGKTMEQAMTQAQKESLKYFPETWLRVRAMVPHPWEGSDTALAVQVAEEAEVLRSQVRELIDQRTQAEARIEQLEAEIRRSSGGKGEGKGFVPFAGTGNTLDAPVNEMD